MAGPRLSDPGTRRPRRPDPGVSADEKRRTERGPRRPGVEFLEGRLLLSGGATGDFPSPIVPRFLNDDSAAIFDSAPDDRGIEESGEIQEPPPEDGRASRPAADQAEPEPLAALSLDGVLSHLPGVSQTASRFLVIRLQPGTFIEVGGRLPDESIETTDWLYVPWAETVSVAGFLGDDLDRVPVMIPVGPKTQAIRVSVRGDGGLTGPQAPVVERLDLLHPTGFVMAHVGGLRSAGGDPLQDLCVMLNGAPAGGRLLVWIAESATRAPGGSWVEGRSLALQSPLISPTSGAVEPRSDLNSDARGASVVPERSGFGSLLSDLDPSPSSAGQTPTRTVPFLVRVDRSEATGKVSEIPEQASRPWPLLLMSFSTAHSLPLPPPRSGSVSVWNPPILVRSETSDSPSEIPTKPGGTEPGSERLLALDPGRAVAVGPLVSRGSSPLGPKLATTTDDPTPIIDRHERAFDDAIERLVSGTNPALILGRNAQRDESRFSKSRSLTQGDTDPEPSATTVVVGPGAYPLRVTSIERKQDSSEPARLLATLANLDEQTPPPNPKPPVLSPEDGSNRSPRMVFARLDLSAAEFLNRAGGLILGMGLTLGPVYPDLISLLRNRVSGFLRPRLKLRLSQPSRRQRQRFRSSRLGTQSSAI